MLYYATTTLLSVGYGDYYPISTKEKIVASFVLLLGVTIYSTLFGRFMACIQEYIKITKPSVLHRTYEI